ncbi:GNAT family N-acetyltransferase [Aggregicoccus sp. 17bor-14]|uniref:GNAT family N-acetyltransferase n=1 Tax=Myxococcaceae TaxID=31 RepID=UPI00129CB403|nr:MULTISPECIES: GNAT family N-acetyltransferase [Myxococcaceae]MBF5045393.1 GNAT family N-acetyltransferase [Simulacricoccus sp. 17bor-14]MRI91134.1 GNAT family N-acetyltransferase [Aggregicoccus sp. 17bor-14]
MPHLPLVTERLVLRALCEDDLDPLAQLLGDPVAMRYFPRPRTRDESRVWIARNHQRYAVDGCGLWAVERRADGAFLGDCGLVMQRPEGQPEVEVGYHFAPEHWGRGYATEAAAACVRLAFEVLRAPRVIALVHPDNLPSARVAARLGMRPLRRVEHAGLDHDLFVVERPPAP